MVNRLIQHSKSQLRQDLFVLSELSFKRNGFFVEFGATNGIDLSNTHLLETKFDWRGILAEPAKVWHAELLANRKAFVELDCVWKASGETLIFNEVAHERFKGEFSTIDSFSSSDNHGNLRSRGLKYEVNSISLLDMLEKYNAPKSIDYLSIDTEGSEYEILSAFDFRAYDIKIITCEHNFTPMREKLFKLLTEQGYQRKFTQFSRWDDWYVRT
jgi:FkbM family methyltransferase